MGAMVTEPWPQAPASLRPGCFAGTERCRAERSKPLRRSRSMEQGKMRRLDIGRMALCSYAAAAVLAGCGVAQPPIGVPRAVLQSRKSAVRGHNNYDATGPLLYVTDFITWTVTVYHASARDPAPIATVSQDLNAPAGDCIDSHGTLYVTDEPISGPGWVSEYRLGVSKPLRIITKGIDTPAYCAIDSNSNLWVTNIGGANVTEYLYGSKRPHTVITNGVPHPVGIAIDRSGNLYVANRLTSSNVVVYAPGSTTPSRTITDGITSPVAIAIDSNGVLYVTNDNEGNVEEYQPGGYYPFKTITQGLITPVAVTVNKKGWLYVANQEQNNVLEYQPGSITPSKRRVTKGVRAPIGLAIYPAVLP